MPKADAFFALARLWERYPEVKGIIVWMVLVAFIVWVCRILAD